MTYQISRQVSQHLFLRDAPERKYPPPSYCFCPPEYPSRDNYYTSRDNYYTSRDNCYTSRDNCYTDCYDCCCCCCCCCCYRYICCEPYKPFNPCLNFDYSSSNIRDIDRNKYIPKRENKKDEENKNINKSKNEKEEPKAEIKEQPKESQVEQIQVEENQGEENQGEENQGEENQGEENQGEENQGEENQGEENQVNENQGEENQGGENKKINEYNNYEQNQFNEFMKKLMAVESQVEDAKISLAMNPDFNCEDAFKLFESNDKDYLDINDIKEGLNLIGLNPTEKQLNLLMKRFDLLKNGYISYADFFDMIVPFEKNQRQTVENRAPKSNCPSRSPSIFKEKTISDLKKLFELLIKTEEDINNERKTLGTLRLKLKEIFALLDKEGKGYFEIEEMIVYFTNNGLLDNNKDADLLFIRLDKKRNGKIDYPEVEDEFQTLY